MDILTKKEYDKYKICEDLFWHVMENFGCFTSKYVLRDISGTGGDIHEEASV